MYRSMLCAFVVLALTPASSVWADNTAIVSLVRIDDFVFPGAEFLFDLEINLDVAGVASVSAQAGNVALTFDEGSPGEWEQIEEPLYANLAALQSAVDGMWTITITGTFPSTTTFTVGAAGLVDGDFFPTPTNVSPANGATDVSSTALLSWTDPTGLVTPYALILEVEDDGSLDQEALSIPDLGILDIPINATSWQPPLALPDGLNEFFISYVDVDLTVINATISAFQVTSGTIAWNNSEFSPPGYPATTPLLVLASETVVGFTVPEPSAGLLGAAALTTLAGLKRRRSLVDGRVGG